VAVCFGERWAVESGAGVLPADGLLVGLIVQRRFHRLAYLSGRSWLQGRRKREGQRAGEPAVVA